MKYRLEGCVYEAKMRDFQQNLSDPIRVVWLIALYIRST